GPRISQGWRGPLAPLAVAADHLKHGHVENVEQARRYGAIIDAQSTRLQHVVDQTLALTKLSESNGAADRPAVSVCEIVDAACDALTPTARENRVTLERHTASDLPLVSVDGDVLLRCLTNLIENALKYAASGRWIRVSTRPARH